MWFSVSHQMAVRALPMPLAAIWCETLGYGLSSMTLTYFSLVMDSYVYVWIIEPSSIHNIWKK